MNDGAAQRRPALDDEACPPDRPVMSAAGTVVRIRGAMSRRALAEQLLSNTGLDAASHPGRSLMRQAGLGADDLPVAEAKNSRIPTALVDGAAYVGRDGRLTL